MPGTTLSKRYSNANRARSSSTKVGRKKYNKRASTKLVRVVGWAFPPQFECDMMYSDVILMSLTSGAFTTYGYRCNGIFDPNGTGTGGSCLYYDKLNSIYGQSTVISSNIEVQVASPSAVTNAVTFGIYTDDDGSWSTTLQSALNRPHVTSQQWNTVAGIPKPFKFGWSAATAFGNPTPWTDDQLTAQPSALCAEQMNYVLFAEEAAAITMGLYCRVKINYRVRWFELLTTAV